MIRHSGSFEAGGVDVGDVVADDFEAFAEGFDAGDAAVEGV